MTSGFPSGFTVGFKTSPQAASWAQLDETWAAAGELDVFVAGWLNDHLTDMTDAGGPSLEALTLLATLAHRVPGKWVGHGVLSNTFRHPAVVAKAATVLDHATGGRFVLGLGAGWHEFEHRTFGIPLPPIGERIDRLESAVEVITALFSPDAASPPGITRPDRFYPLEGATNEPPPLTPGGPPIFLGGQGRRGIALAGRAADGWLLPGVNAGDERYFAAKRERAARARWRPPAAPPRTSRGSGRCTSAHRLRIESGRSRRAGRSGPSERTTSCSACRPAAARTACGSSQQRSPSRSWLTGEGLPEWGLRALAFSANDRE